MADKKPAPNAIPTEQDDIATLEAVRNKIEADITKIEKKTDPAEKLLAYKQLKDGYRELFNPDDGKKTSKYVPEGSIREVMADDAGGNGATAGLVGGMGVGAAAGFGVATLLTGGLAALAIIPGLAAWAGTTFVAGWLGEKRGRKKFKKLPRLQQLASQLYELDRSVNEAITKLGSTDDKNLNALAQSPRFEDIQKEFPHIASAFNERAKDLRAREEAIAKRQAFLNGTAAEDAPAVQPRAEEPPADKKLPVDKPQGSRVDPAILKM